MRKENNLRLFSAMTALLFVFSFLPFHSVRAIEEPTGKTVVTYFSLNDFHGTVDDSASSSNPGVARVQTYIKDHRATTPHTYLVSAGDQYQGSPISNLTKGEVVNEILKEMGMIASAVGNHEFDWGSDLIPLWAEDGGFFFLASNIEVEEDAKPEKWDDYVKPYWVHEIDMDGHTVKIGMVGLATPETSYKTLQEHVEGFTFTDPVTATNKYAKILVDDYGVDAVIALTHLGSYQSGDVITGEAAELAKGVSNVDAIFSGHTHQVVNGKVNGITIVQGQFNARSLGQLDLVFDTTGDAPVFEEVRGSVVNIRNLKPTLLEDPAVKAIIDTYYVELQPILAEELGTLVTDLPHNTDTMEVTPMGQFIAKAMMEIGGTDVAIINGGGIRIGFEAGPITMGMMYTLLPFDNTLVTLKVSGAELKQLIDHGINPPDFRSGQFYGLEVTYNPYNTYKSRIVEMTLSDGTPIVDEEYYTVSTLDFIVGGGDRYDFSKATEVLDTYIPIRDVIAEMIRETGTIDYSYVPNIHAVESSVHAIIDYYSLNDFHGAVDQKVSTSNPGLARIQTFLKQQRALNPYSYLVSAGDQYQGSAISNLTKGEVTNEALKAMGLLASAVGNHEFDWGSHLIPQWAKDGSFKFLASNITVEDSAKPELWDEYVVPYMVHEVLVEGRIVKIGLIGLATQETAYKTAAENVVGFTFEDPAPAANKWAKHLLEEEGVDAVIALTHLGSTQTPEGVVGGEAAELAMELVGVDAMFTGHYHQVVNGVVNDVVIVQGGFNGRWISQLSLHVEIHENHVEVVDIAADVHNIRNLIPALDEDPEIKALIDAYYLELDAILSKVLGVLLTDLPHDTDTMQVTPMGQFVAKALSEIGGTQIAIVNGGGIRGGLEAGEITMGDMYSILPFDNTLVTLKVNGAELKKLIEHGLHPANFRPGQFYGITVWYDPEAPAGERISTLRLADGTLVTDDGIYSVSTLDFLLTGGDNYDFSQAFDVEDTNIPVRDFIAAMIEEKGEIAFTMVENLIAGEEDVDDGDNGDDEDDEDTPVLPGTGAASTGLFYGAGTMMMLAAGVLARKRRKGIA